MMKTQKIHSTVFVDSIALSHARPSRPKSHAVMPVAMVFGGIEENREMFQSRTIRSLRQSVWCVPSNAFQELAKVGFISRVVGLPMLRLSGR